MWDDPRVLRSALPALLSLFACAAYDCGGHEPAPVAPGPEPVREPATPTVAPPAHAATVGVRVPEPSHPTPAGAPHALVRVPEGFQANEPWDLVVFLHGWNGCVNVLMRPGSVRCAEGAGPEREGWDLAAAFDTADANALLLMPQLAFHQREGSAGRFVEPGFVRELVDAVAAQVDAWPASAPRRTVVTAHSAGFESALAWIRQDGLPVDEVVLFDALYAGTETFADWVSVGDRRLVSIHTGRGSTARQSRRLRRLAARAELAVGSELSSEAPVIVMESDAPHRDVPSAHLATVVRSGVWDETSPTEIQ